VLPWKRNGCVRRSFERYRVLGSAWLLAAACCSRFRPDSSSRPSPFRRAAAVGAASSAARTRRRRPRHRARIALGSTAVGGHHSHRSGPGQTPAQRVSLRLQPVRAVERDRVNFTGFTNSKGISSSANTVANAFGRHGPHPGLFTRGSPGVQPTSRTQRHLVGWRSQDQTHHVGQQTSSTGNQRGRDDRVARRLLAVGSMSASTTAVPRRLQVLIPDLTCESPSPPIGHSRSPFSADSLANPPGPTAPTTTSERPRVTRTTRGAALPTCGRDDHEQARAS